MICFSACFSLLLTLKLFRGNVVFGRCVALLVRSRTRGSTYILPQFPFATKPILGHTARDTICLFFSCSLSIAFSLKQGILYLFPPASAGCLGRGLLPPASVVSVPSGSAVARCCVVVLLIGIATGYERAALLPCLAQGLFAIDNSESEFVRSQGCKSESLKEEGFRELR